MGILCLKKIQNKQYTSEIIINENIPIQIFSNLENKLKNIKSNYILQKIFYNLAMKKSLEIVKYNKNLKERLKKNINDYKEYSESYSSIEIELIPVNDKYGYFINIKKEDKKYFHIYFNNNKEEIKRSHINKDEKIKIIKIIIDY